MQYNHIHFLYNHIINIPQNTHNKFRHNSNSSAPADSYKLLPQKTMIPCFVNNLDHDLEMGPYGIQQPRMPQAEALPMEDIDLSIVPGVAFDKQNHRLGRGAGYYDRFLMSFPSGKPTIGLAYDFQILDSLPTEEHDIPVTRVISN